MGSGDLCFRCRNKYICREPGRNYFCDSYEHLYDDNGKYLSFYEPSKFQGYPLIDDDFDF